MNVARINFAHGDTTTLEEAIANVRAAAAQTDQRVTIMGDLPGPKMRIGELAEEPVTLERGQPFTLQTTPTLGDRFHAWLDFDALTTAFKPGDRVFMDDGYLLLFVYWFSVKLCLLPSPLAGTDRRTQTECDSKFNGLVVSFGFHHMRRDR